MTNKTVMTEAVTEIVALAIENEALRKKLAEAQQFCDLFVADWRTAPEWAMYHTVDPDGTGVWWSGEGIVLGVDGWYVDSEVVTRYQQDTNQPYDMDGLDWHNSLRARPEVQP
jgi:hypothetical protein